MNRDNSFDKIIKEKLDRVAPVAPQGDWERLLERMEHLPGSEEEDTAFFDQMVKRKAPSSHDSGLSQNWISLVSRLDRIYAREQQLLSSKILELAALLLLLIFIDKDYSGRGSYYQAQTVPAVSPATQSIQDEGLQSASLGSSQDHCLTPLFSNSRSLAPSTLQHDLHLSQPLQEVILGQVDVSPINTLPITIADHIQPLHTNTQFAFLPPSVEPAAPSITAKTEPNAFGSLYGGKIIRIRPERRLTMSMFGGPEINYVFTPEATAGATSVADRTPVTLPEVYRFAQGYSGGGTIAWGKGKWELETGLIYTAKQYRARRVLYLTGSVRDGFFGEGITDIELNVAAIPLAARYELFRSNGWRAYGGVGGAMQLVIESNYAVADQEAFRSSRFNPDPEAFDSPGLLKRSGLTAKTLYSGLLEGGDFSNNTFFTASASFGLERNFRSGWSFFAQPTYHHSILYLSKGLGPDYDRIHTFSIYSGVRIRL